MRIEGKSKIVSVTTEGAFIEALPLPVRERASLAHALIRSLESEEASPEVEEAWKREALEPRSASGGGDVEERQAERTLRRLRQRMDI